MWMMTVAAELELSERKVEATYTHTQLRVIYLRQARPAYSFLRLTIGIIGKKFLAFCVAGHFKQGR